MSVNMDQSLIDLSIDYHGPALVDRLAEEQPNIRLPNFLSLKQEGKSCETPRDPAFENQIATFIAKKADLLFMPNNNTRRPNIPDKKENDNYAIVPPLESFMGVPTSLCRESFLKDLRPGDVVIAGVSAVQESGLQLSILSVDCGKVREIDQLRINAFCPMREVPKYFAHESALDTFTLKDKVRGVVLSVKPESEKIIVSLLPESLPPDLSDLKMGLIGDDELPVHYKRLQDLDSCTAFEDCLLSSQGFFNCCNVQYLSAQMRLCDGDSSPSLMRVFHGAVVCKGDTAVELRKAQSYRWAFKSVAEGVSYFKEGRYVEAMQHLNMALKIDPEHVEALVARGALYANNESYLKALEDFEKALALNPNHSNARKYTCETLLAHSRSFMDTDKETDAEKYLERVLVLDPDNDIARHWLYRLRHKSPRKASVADDISMEEESKIIDLSESPDQERFSMRKTTETLRKLIEEEKESRKNKKRRRPSDSSPEVSPSQKKICASLRDQESGNGHTSKDVSHHSPSEIKKSAEFEECLRRSGKKRTSSVSDVLFRNRSRSPDQRRDCHSLHQRSRSKSPTDIGSKSSSNSLSPETKKPEEKKLYQESDSLSPDSLQYIKDRQSGSKTNLISSSLPLYGHSENKVIDFMPDSEHREMGLEHFRNRKRYDFEESVVRKERPQGKGTVERKVSHEENWKGGKQREKSTDFFSSGYWSCNDPKVEKQKISDELHNVEKDYSSKIYDKRSSGRHAYHEKGVMYSEYKGKDHKPYIEKDYRRRSSDKHYNDASLSSRHKDIGHTSSNHEKPKRGKHRSGDTHREEIDGRQVLGKSDERTMQSSRTENSSLNVSGVRMLVSYPQSPTGSPAQEYLKTKSLSKDSPKHDHHYIKKNSSSSKSPGRSEKVRTSDDARMEEHSVKNEGSREGHSRHDSGTRKDIQDKTITSSSDSNPRNNRRSSKGYVKERSTSRSDNRSSTSQGSNKSFKQEDITEHNDSNRRISLEIKRTQHRHVVEKGGGVYKKGQRSSSESSSETSSSSSSTSSGDLSEEEKKSKYKHREFKDKSHQRSKSDGKLYLAQKSSPPLLKHKLQRRRSFTIPKFEATDKPGFKEANSGNNNTCSGKSKTEKECKEEKPETKPGESLEEMEMFLRMLKTKKKEKVEQEKQEQPKQSYKRW